MATKKTQPSPAPLVVQPAQGLPLPDLPTEDDAPVAEHLVPETPSEVNVAPAPTAVVEFAPADPNRKGGVNNPLTMADSIADQRSEPRPVVEHKVVSESDLAFMLQGGAATTTPGTMRVAIKHLSDRAKTPTYGSAGAACFDLYAADTLAVAPGRSAVVPTDLAFEVPEGYVLMIYSRSGHGFKHGIRLANNTGVVDSDYRGHVPVCLHNDGRDVFYVHQGDRVAQAMIVPVPRVEFAVVDELSSTERGENGFGSTGR